MGAGGGVVRYRSDDESKPSPTFPKGLQCTVVPFVIEQTSEAMFPYCMSRRNAYVPSSFQISTEVGVSPPLVLLCVILTTRGKILKMFRRVQGRGGRAGRTGVEAAAEAEAETEAKS